VRAVTRPVRLDLERDPKLRYVLLFAGLVFAVGIWFRVPNFAGPDEYSRLIQPMKVAGRVAASPGLDSLQAAATDGRALGATLYLYALVLAPIFLVILATGQLGQFVSLGGIESRWVLWHEAPAWFWTSSVLLGRAVSVALGVATVYLVYRLGVRLRDRWTGRVAAVGLAVTFGFVESAHTINEDIPMVFLLLVALLCCLRYVESGDRRTFLLACFTAALAVTFKLTGGSAVVAVGVAYLLHARRVTEPRAALVQPWLLLGGLAVGVGTIAVGFPSVLFGGPDELLVRLTASTTNKTTSTRGVIDGVELALLRGYLAAFGLPLLVGATLGVVATLWDAVTGPDSVDDRLAVVATPVVVTLAVFSQWQFVWVHHLMPTLPPLLLLGALGVQRLDGHWETGVRAGLALLFVTSLAFSGFGTVQLTTDPRDEATDWLRSNADPDDTVLVYENSIADVAAVHGRPVEHYDYQEENATYNSSLVLDRRAYTEWMLGTPERGPAYIQLTGEELNYVTPGHTDREQFPRRAAFIEGLLDGEYNYTVVAQFGERRTEQSVGERLFRAGVEPEPQSRESVVIILARDDIATGE